MLAYIRKHRCAVFIEEGVWLALSELAIITAGCCIIPLDPAHPQQRLQTLLDDCMPTLAMLTPEQVSPPPLDLR